MPPARGSPEVPHEVGAAHALREGPDDLHTGATVRVTQAHRRVCREAARQHEVKHENAVLVGRTVSAKQDLA